MKTRLIALDVYGTFLCSHDPERALPPREGFISFLERVKQDNIIIVTASDAPVENQ